MEGEEGAEDDMSRNIVTDFDSKESGAFNPSISSLDTQPPVKNITYDGYGGSGPNGDWDSESIRSALSLTEEAPHWGVPADDDILNTLGTDDSNPASARNIAEEAMSEYVLQKDSLYFHPNWTHDDAKAPFSRKDDIQNFFHLDFIFQSFGYYDGSILVRLLHIVPKVASDSNPVVRAFHHCLEITEFSSVTTRHHQAHDIEASLAELEYYCSAFLHLDSARRLVCEPVQYVRKERLSQNTNTLLFKEVTVHSRVVRYCPFYFFVWTLRMLGLIQADEIAVELVGVSKIRCPSTFHRILCVSRFAPEGWIQCPQLLSMYFHLLAAELFQLINQDNCDSLATVILEVRSNFGRSNHH